MPTTNPYDRREEAKRRARRGHEGETVNVDGYYSDVLADGRRAYPGFGLDRLQELMRDEYARGYNCGEGTAERKFEEEILPRLRRQLWDEGHAAGVDDGEAETLKRIAELYEDVVNGLSADISQVLADDGATVKNMRPLLSQAVNLLGQLVEAHHGGFGRPMPF